MNAIYLFISLLAITPLWSQAEPDERATELIEEKGTDVTSEGLVEETLSPKPARRKTTERLEVTGSYIRRTDVEGPSPILVIDREQIEKSGFNTVGDVLRRSAVAPFGGDGSTVNLKGLGSGRTLVLINGQRAPGSGNSYASGAVSTNFVPIAAVERIEVLKDGASATYGSDALGGVVNIITRKDLDGFTIANKYDHTNYIGGDTNLASLAYGRGTDKDSLISSIQIRNTQQVRTSNINYLTELNRSPNFSTNYRNVDGNDFGPLIAGPDCTSVNTRGACSEENSSRQISLPRMDVDWVTDYSRDVGSDITFYSTFLAGSSFSGNRFPNTFTTPGNFAGIGLEASEVPASWAGLPGYDGGDIRVNHRIDEMHREVNERGFYGALILGAKGYVGNSDWEWDVTLNNQINHFEQQLNNLATFSGTRSALVSGAYDPFDSASRDTSGIGISGLNRNQSMVNWFEAKTNGNLGRFSGLDWASAFGLSFANFEYFDRRMQPILDNDIMGRAGVVTDGERQLSSFFAEFSGIQSNKFELQFSMRGDFYSDFGYTFNPKIAARYQPTNWLTLRSSAGTGFQAPTLQNMNAQLESFVFVTDRVRCDAIGGGDLNHPECANNPYSAFQDTNPDLREERSQSLNLGAIIQPTKSFTFSVDWWYVKVTDTIGVNISDILFLEALDPNAPSRYGVDIIRQGGSPTGEIDRINSTLINAGTEEAQGVDLEMAFSLPTPFGDFRFVNETTYMGSFYQSFYEELGRDQILGRFARPRWRNNFTASYTRNQLTVQTVARSFSDMERQNRETGKIVSPTQFDLTLLFNTESYGQFQAGVLNLGRIQPRFDVTLQQRINTNLFQGIQTFFLNWRTDF